MTTINRYRLDEHRSSSFSNNNGNIHHNQILRNKLVNDIISKEGKECFNCFYHHDDKEDKENNTNSIVKVYRNNCEFNEEKIPNNNDSIQNKMKRKVFSLSEKDCIISHLPLIATCTSRIEENNFNILHKRRNNNKEDDEKNKNIKENGELKIYENNTKEKKFR